jgi:hypothetical protein
MPYTHEWLVDGKVLYNRITNPYTDDEVARSSDAAVELLSSAPTPAYFIVNTLGLTSFPHNIVRATSSVQKFMTHPNMHQLLVISDNSAVRFVSLLATQIQRNKLILYGSIDEALAYITRQAPDLADQIKKPSV